MRQLKALTCILMILLLLTGCAGAQTVRMGFEDGFCLDLPGDWQYYPVDDEMAAEGVTYCLSDANASRWLYIQHWGGACADAAELHELVIETEAPKYSGIYSFNGLDCVVYDLADEDISCCCTLIDGRIINFMFTPQSDSVFMQLAAEIMASLNLIDA